MKDLEVMLSGGIVFALFGVGGVARRSAVAAPFYVAAQRNKSTGKP